MKYFSMFSGIGGFELGIQRTDSNKQSAEVKQDGQGRDRDTNEGGNDVLSSSGTAPFCIGFSEIDKYAIQVYQKHFKGHKNYGDAKRIIPEELPDFDFLCGGFPCQAFSIAGKRGGFKDTRGTLFFEIARVISVKRPKLLLLENVKGLLSHDSGRTFGTILTALSELGYICEWQVLNSKDFGVPQNRERVFIVGHFGEGSGRKVFPVGESNRKTISKTILDVNQAQRVYGVNGLAITQKALGGGQGAKTGLYAIPILTPNRETKRQNGRRTKTDGEPMFTLTSQDIHGVYDGCRVRRLTPTECCRLQGFPDDWCDGLSDNQKYRCLGNAVTTNVITAIMERIYAIQNT